ncbi:hypothetical protein [Rhodococcus sp. (in: high G+C Gram-positive bacteria)]|uniref:hypothetical protein n=1 Tax=Rhodococcus sp. TaxID=1831 RepID=UPI003F06AAE6
MPTVGCVVVEHESVLPATSPAVWARITDPGGINDELAPVLSMRMPRAVRGLSIDEVPVGVRLGRAPLLLFGILPVEFDDLTVAAVEPGRRFHEKSSMVLLRRWEHERELQPLPSGGTRVHDRLTFELRAPLSRVPIVVAVAHRVIAGLFAHRHRRLARYFHRPPA